MTFPEEQTHPVSITRHPINAADVVFSVKEKSVVFRSELGCLCRYPSAEACADVVRWLMAHYGLFSRC